MLRHRKNIPLDYSLCQDTVTVYRREDLTRHILDKVHLEETRRRSLDVGREEREENFLLIIPGTWDLQPGDRLCLGEVGEALPLPGPGVPHRSQRVEGDRRSPTKFALRASEVAPQ